MASYPPILDDQIARLKEVTGLKTDTALGKMLGLCSGAVFSAKRRGRVPNRWFVIISRRYNVNLEWLISGVGPRAMAPKTEQPEDDARGTGMSKDFTEISVIGLDTCAYQGWHTPRTVALKAPLPANSAGARAFAVIAFGSDMEPEGIKPGQVLFCDPEKEPEEGDAVYIERGDLDEGAVYASLKKFLAKDDQWLYVRSWKEDRPGGAFMPDDTQLDLRSLEALAVVVMVKRRA